MYEREWGYKIPHDEISTKDSEWVGAVNEIKNFKICDTSEILRKKLTDGKRILAEGAQGAMLDNDYGDYPYVTSSNTLTASACLGLGFPHHMIGDVYGVIKADTTKVGGGAFPSRIKDEEEEKLYQEAGHEFGATTGRRRMCGWIDLPALKRAIYLSGVNKLCINKVDICPVDYINVVTGYRDKNNEKMTDFPLHLEDVDSTEEFTFEGWDHEDAVSAKHWENFPKELTAYIIYLEDELSPLGVKIVTVGTGPERGQNVSW
jgi:adenylosuccinate synthase